MLMLRVAVPVPAQAGNQLKLPFVRPILNRLSSAARRQNFFLGDSLFKALVVDNRSGSVTAAVQELDEPALPAGNVLVAVEYSTVNYKDGLVVTGAGGLVKNYPMEA